MAGSKIGSFGNVVFEASSETVRTFDNFNRRTRATYARHETVTGKPSLEFTGLGLDEISMTMMFCEQLGISPEDEDEQLREMVRSGEAHPLILGDTNYGYFAIEEVGGEGKYFINGRFMVIEVDLKLVEYDMPASGAGADALAREKAGQRIPSGVKAD